MSEQTDFSALEWVKGEISESLRQAQHALEAFVANPNDSTKMQFCITHLHQVWGTLQMVELEGATLFSAEMEALAQAMADGEVKKPAEAQEVLMQAFLQLPAYLDNLASGSKDMPEVLLPMLNDLRSIRDEKLMSDSEFFNPDLASGHKIAQQREESSVSDLEDQLHKLRKAYQKSLLAVIKGESLEKNLDYMGKILARLQKLSGKSQISQIWWISGAMIDGLLAGSIDFSKSVSSLLAAIDRQIKEMVDDHKKTLSSEVSKELAKNLLYYVASSEPSTKRIANVQKAYKLSVALPKEVREEQSQQARRGLVNEAIVAAVDVLIEDLLNVNEVLDLVVRGKGKEDDRLKELLPVVKSIAGALHVLSLKEARDTMAAQYKIIGACVAGKVEDIKSELMGVAGQLLAVESSLNDIAKHGLSGKILIGEISNQEKVSSDQLGAAQKVLLNEAIASLETVKELFAALLASGWSSEVLEEAAVNLKALSGSLKIIPLTLASEILEKSADYINEKLIPLQSSPEQEELEAFADVLSSVDYFLEKLRSDSRSDTEALNVGVERLAVLGYPIGDVEGLKPVQATVIEEAEETEALSEILSAEEEDSVRAEAEAAEEKEVEQIPEEAQEEERPEEEAAPVEAQAEVEEQAVAEAPEETAEEITEEVTEESAEPVTAEAAEEEEDESVIDDEIIEIFIEEVGEVQETLSEFLPKWQDNTGDEESLTEVRRAFHTLKGSGRMVGATEMGEMAWCIENMLNRVIDNTISASEVLLQTVNDAVDTVPELLELFKQAKNEATARSNEISARAEKIANGESVELGELPEATEEVQEAQEPAEAITEPVAEVVEELQESVEQAEETEVEEVVAEQVEAAEMDSAELLPEYDEEIAEIFSQEALGHTENLKQFTDTCRQTSGPWVLSDDVLRVMHTLKGCANMAAIEPVAPVVTKAENFVKELRLQDKKANEEVISLIEHVCQLTNQVIEELPKISEGSKQLADTTLNDISNLTDTLLKSDAGELEGDSGKQARIDQFLGYAFDLIFDGEDYFNEYTEAWSDESTRASSQENLTNLARECEEIAELASQCELDEISELAKVISQASNHARQQQIPEELVKDISVAVLRLTEIVDFLAAGQFIKSPAKITAKVQEQLDSLPEIETETETIETPPLAEVAEVVEADEIEAQVTEESVEAEQPSVEEPETEEPETEEIEIPLPVTEEVEEPALDMEVSELSVEAEAEEQVEATEIQTEESSEIEAVEVEVEEQAIPVAEVEEVEVTEEAPEQEAAPPEAEAEVEAASIENRMDDDIERDPEIVEIFIEEAEEIIENSANLLEQWQDDSSDMAVVAELQRDLHTLKGGARMAEFASIGDLGHELENIYEGVGAGQLSTTPELFNLLFRCHDRISEMFADIRDNGNCYRADDLLAEIKSLVGGEAVEEIVELEEASTSVEIPEATLEEEPAESVEEVEELELEESIEATLPDETVEAELETSAVEEAEEVEVEEELAELGSEEDSSKIFEDEEDSELDADLELVEIFLEEAEEIIESSANALEEWRGDSDNIGWVEQLQRELHTLKGGARMAQISEIGDFAHEMENVYEGMVAGTVKKSDLLTNLLFTCHDRLNEMVSSLRENNTCEAAEDLVDQLKLAFQNKLGEAPAAEKAEESKEAKGKKAAKAIKLEKDIEKDVIEQFYNDGQEIVKQLEGALLNLQASNDETNIEQAREVLTSLSGGANLSGFKSLEEYCEDFKKVVIEGTDTEALTQGMKDIQDFMALLEKELPKQKEKAPAKKAPAKKAPAKKAAAKPAAKDSQAESIKISADLLENLVNLAGETSINRGRLEMELSEFSFIIEEIDDTIERLQEQLRRLHLETEAQIVSRYEKEGPSEEEAAMLEMLEEDEDFDPLEMDKYSAIDQLSRSLQESASDLIDLKETLLNKTKDAETLLLQQGRINTEMQEGLMRSRMVPFSRLLPRLRRIVRQVGNELKKPVDLEVLNAEGELDRAVLERMVSPIEHMLRNSIAHGIEKAADRKSAGKPKNGTISIDLGREGSNMVIKLQDDGAGVNVEAVRKKAIENGLMDKNANLPDSEIVEFIFNSGFSTAAAVSQVAGRGVGMDVVASEIKELGGTIETNSVTGSGTTFIIRLPFTVAVNRALMVNIGEDLYAIPLTSIEGVVRVSPYELEAYYEEEEPVFNYAGVDYSLQYLGSYMHGHHKPNFIGHTRPLPVLLVQTGEHAVAMQVDSLLGSREVVVKSVGPQLSTVAGIQGATILGDGSVVIILDIHSMIRGAIAQKTSVSIQSDVMEAREADRPTQVMVIDDSVTVRKVTSRLLERNGMEVILAKDGVDAITQLQEVKPDVMLLDIEMPRMDGFEVATLVRHDDRLKEVPIIMITSRTGEKHKQRAMDIGVNRYMGKPFQENQLLQTIEELTSEAKGEAVKN